MDFLKPRISGLILFFIILIMFFLFEHYMESPSLAQGTMIILSNYLYFGIVMDQLRDIARTLKRVEKSGK